MADENKAKKEGIALFGSADTAAILGISTRYLQILTKEGILQKEGHGKYEIAKVVSSFLNWRIAQYENEQDSELDFKKEKTLLTRVQRKKAETELSIMKGKLHKSEDVERVMNSMLSAFRARCLVIPTRAAPLIVNGKKLGEIKQILKSEIYEALQELSDYNPDSFHKPPESEEEETADYERSEL